MKRYAALPLALMAIAFPSASYAETVFECALTNGRTVGVTSEGDRLTYRYGTAQRAELTLTGSPSTGSVSHLSERYFNILHQLRFRNGRYSYIVYSLPGSERADARGSFGVSVLRDGNRIGDTQCRRETEFQSGFDLFQALPQDDEGFNVMSID